MPQERLLKFNDENIAKQKALVDARKAEAAAATAAKNAAADASAARARADSRKTPASSSAARGTKRGREPDADEGERRPEIKLNVPDALKVQLVDDWENVTRKEQLVPLPRKPNVKEILNEYAEYYASSPARKNAARPRSPAVLLRRALFSDERPALASAAATSASTSPSPILGPARFRSSTYCGRSNR